MADLARGFADGLAVGRKRLSRWLKDNPDAIRQAVEAVQAFTIAAIDDIAESENSFARAQMLDPAMVETLARHGWYPTPEKSLMQHEFWAWALEESDAEQVESARQIGFKIFREDAHGIEARLVEQFPHRADILREAFEAHRHQRYFSSVALFLTQADGICQEIIGKSIYRAKTIAQADDIGEQFQEGILRELFMGLMWHGWPLVLSDRKRPSGFSELNRHQVLHGESTDFGTEECSLKAMSFLNFSAFLLEGVKS
ncbi:MAG: hypothetical protein OXG57_03535 [Acidimicrobiaceae bacterium]|nr:hypothetical protein [Acidimicrobiaceae bacterium]